MFFPWKERRIMLSCVNRAFLIDTDTAADDAVALIMALKAKDVLLLAITTVAGNVDVDTATRNAVFTVELCHADVPVYRGNDKPLTRQLDYVNTFHGRDGLGDHGFRARNQPAKGYAVDVMIALLEQNPGLTLVTLGPLTNIAALLLQRSDLAKNIGRCVVMGGAPHSAGNITPAAEFKFWVDPEAARIVLRSGMEIELVGFQLSRADAVLDSRDIQRIETFKTEPADFLLRANSRVRASYAEQTSEDGIPLADGVAMAIALDPSIAVRWSKYYADVEIDNEPTRGKLGIDPFHATGRDDGRRLSDDAIVEPPHISVCWQIDVPKWKQTLYEALK
jgi:purine nucleosidase